MNKASVVKAALTSKRSKFEGSAAEEAGESKPFKKKEDSGKPSGGMSSSAKSKAVKQAKAGKDFGKKNVPGKTGFGAVEANAKKEGMSDASAQKVAGAVFWKKVKRGA